MELKINPEYSEMAPRLSPKKYQDLKENIKQNGQLDTIKVNKEWEILDGHHRDKILLELGREPKTETLEFPNKYLEKLFVININRDRRQLNEFSDIELALQAKPIYEQMVKENMSLGGKGVRIQTPLGRIDQRIADDAHSSKYKVGAVEFLLKYAKPEDIKRFRQGAKYSKAYNSIIWQQSYEARLKQALNDVQNLPLQNEMYELHQGDMTEKGDLIPDNSVQAIITDPPYDLPSLPIYGHLAKLAERKLKVGGCLAALTGGYAFSRITRLIEDNSSLTWQWDIVLKHNGPSEIISGMQVKHKTWVLFYKGDKPTIHGPMPTLFESEKPDKGMDDWAQSPEDARPLIRYLTVPGEIVLDPLTGTGTFGVPALEEGRRFIGIEKNKDRFALAKYKLNDTQLRLEQLRSELLRSRVEGEEKIPPPRDPFSQLNKIG